MSPPPPVRFYRTFSPVPLTLENQVRVVIFCYVAIPFQRSSVSEARCPVLPGLSLLTLNVSTIKRPAVAKVQKRMNG